MTAKCCSKTALFKHNTLAPFHHHSHHISLTFVLPDYPCSMQRGNWLVFN